MKLLSYPAAGIKPAALSSAALSAVAVHSATGYTRLPALRLRSVSSTAAPMTLELIQTSALLLALSLLQGLCLRFLSHRPRLAEIASGLVFGGVCVIGMMIPITLAPGVIIDSRSVVLSMAGLFGGPLAGVITGAIAGIYRVTLGGDGMIIGTISIALGVAFGLLYRAAWRGRRLSRRPQCLFAFGVAVHGVSIVLVGLVPGQSIAGLFERLGLPYLLSWGPRPPSSACCCGIWRFAGGTRTH